MSNNDNNRNAYPRPPQQDAQDYEIENEKWNPTPAAFKQFLSRDEALAGFNLNQLFRSSQYPLSLKDLKESSLHSMTVIEKQVNAWIGNGYLQEDKGRFFINPIHKGNPKR